MGVLNYILKNPFVIYLSIYGIKTERFNNLIIDKIKSIDSKIKLDIKDVFLKLDLKKRSIKIYTENSKLNFENKYINFPIEFFNVLGSLDLSTILKIISENTVKQFYPSKKIDNFRDFAYRSYGRTLADLFLINYTEKLWGIK